MIFVAIVIAIMVIVVIVVVLVVVVAVAVIIVRIAVSPKNIVKESSAVMDVFSSIVPVKNGHPHHPSKIFSNLNSLKCLRDKSLKNQDSLQKN